MRFEIPKELQCQNTDENHIKSFFVYLLLAGMSAPKDVTRVPD